jgi:hypothetical protein
MDDLTAVRVLLATLTQESKDTNRRLEHIEKRLDEKVVPREEHENVNTRVTALEDTLKWLVRTLIGAILLATLAALGLGKKVGVL